MPKMKFNFCDVSMSVPEMDADPVATVTAGGQLVIPRSTYTKFGLDGKAVKIVWDPSKKALGLMEILIEFESTGWDKRVMRLLKANQQTGQLKVAVGRILTKVGMGGKDFKRVPFGRYDDTLADRPIYYVLLNKQPDETVRHPKGSEATA